MDSDDEIMFVFGRLSNFVRSLYGRIQEADGPVRIERMTPEERYFHWTTDIDRKVGG